MRAHQIVTSCTVLTVITITLHAYSIFSLTKFNSLYFTWTVTALGLPVNYNKIKKINLCLLSFFHSSFEHTKPTHYWALGFSLGEIICIINSIFVYPTYLMSIKTCPYVYLWNSIHFSLIPCTSNSTSIVKTKLINII